MIKNICFVLATAYPKVNVYREDVQKMRRPLFKVNAINTSQEKKIGNLYTRTKNFSIKFFPERDNISSYEELEEIANNLYYILELMEYEERCLRGYEMKHRIEDNVLQFFVTCKENLKRSINEPDMESLKLEIQKKKEKVKN